MRAHRLVATIALMCAATTARAQSDINPLTPIQVLVACAPAPTLAIPPTAALRVVGGQDTVPRAEFGHRDLLVINGGTTSGVQLGQRFFVRRPVTYGVPSRRPRALSTTGWIRIVAVNDSTAIAAVDFSCADIARDDYLEPFVAPVVPEGTDRPDTSGEPDFTSLGNVMFGHDESRTGATGDFMLINRGSAQGVVPGQRLAIYRDVRRESVPLASLGEGIVISTGTETSLMRITLARDAVETGDLVVPRKP